MKDSGQNGGRPLLYHYTTKLQSPNVVAMSEFVFMPMITEFLTTFIPP